MTRSCKQYFIYHLQENILILDTFEYLQSLAASTVDYLFEWHLVDKNDKAKFKTNIIKQLLESKIKNDVNIFLESSKKYNCLILSFYREQSVFKNWEDYFEDPKKFINVCKRSLKKNLPNFFEDKNKDVRLFQRVKGQFNDIPCLIPSGEDEEFLQKKLKKLRKDT
jgi:hypothetical protein